VQLATAVAADRDQRDRVGESAGMLAPQKLQHAIHDPGPQPDKLRHGLVGEETLGEARPGRRQRRAAVRDVAAVGGKRAHEQGDRRVAGKAAAVIGDGDGRHREGAAQRSAAPSVSTSNPSSVIKTVCSH
jgi:hypothetical protein